MTNANNTTISLEFNPETEVSPEFLNKSLLGAAARAGEIQDLTYHEKDSQMPSFSVDANMPIKEIYNRFIKPFLAVIDGSFIAMANGKEYLLTWYANNQENQNQPGLV